MLSNGHITWEHAWLYSNRRVNAEWAIVPCCTKHNVGVFGLEKEYNRFIALARATHKDLSKYPKKDWNRIIPEFVRKLKDRKTVVEVPAGAMAIWDSRLWHCNQYGDEPEVRMVQYVCMLPKSHPKNTKAMQKKRKKYVEEFRTTSHWPCPIKVNPKQPRTYGDSSLKIDYSVLKTPDLSDLEEKIKEII